VQAMLGQFKVDKSFVLGQISDDYGFSKLQIVYYPKGKLEFVKRGVIQLELMVMISFIFFSGKLAVEQGVSYEYYFEVFDNDARNGFKSSKTPVFSNRIVTDEEKKG
jgi:hypothetical protein